MSDDPARAQKRLTPLQSVKLKAMWLGQLTPTPKKIPVLHAADGSLWLLETTTEQTPALLNAMRELFDNAADHAKLCKGTNKVTEIRVDFDVDSGALRVFNNGPGFVIAKDDELTAELGRDVYGPEIAYTQMGGGNTVKEEDLTTVGVNGVGALGATAHSRRLAVTTVGVEGRGKRKRFRYRQEYLDRCEDIRPAEIRAAEGGEDGTLVEMDPAYAALGYDTAAPGFAAQLADIEAVLRRRLLLVALVAPAHTRVVFNGLEFPAAPQPERLAFYAQLQAAQGDPVPLAAMGVKDAAWCFSTGRSATCRLQAAVALRPEGFQKKRMPGSPLVLALANGAETPMGDHVKLVQGPLGEAVAKHFATRVSKLVKSKKQAPTLTTGETLKLFSIVIVLDLGSCDWGDQEKTKLVINKQMAEDWARLKVPTALAGKAGEAAAARLVAMLADKLRPARKRGPKLPVTKYERAKGAGTAAMPNILTVCEGDSAASTVDKIRRLGGAAHGRFPPVSEKTVGRLLLRGVPINACRNVIYAGGSALPNTKLDANAEFNLVVQALGLDFAKTYETEAERRTLRYGALVCCTDQDLDGVGKILPLVVVMIHTFWPALVRAGFVCRWMSPLVRAYADAGARKSGQEAIAEFYYEADYKEWAAREGAPKHVAYYYKGLGSHNDITEIPSMAPRFTREIVALTADDSAQLRKDLDDYFADDVESMATRKELLQTPVVWPDAATRAGWLERGEQTMRSMLDTDGKALKQEMMNRQWIGLDGLKPAQRKVLYRAMAIWAHGSTEIRVAALAGNVMEHGHYHHGEQSLHGVIINMARAYLGARRFPLLATQGCFGTHIKGGHDAGSPRYIETYLMKQLCAAMFPAADRYVLDFVFEDGVRAEPAWFAPVVPLAILETATSVSEGWNYSHYARDFGAVVDEIERLLAAGETPVAGPRDFPLCREGFSGPVFSWDGRRYSAGAIELVPADRLGPADRREFPSGALRVTALPMAGPGSECADCTLNYSEYMRGNLPEAKKGRFSKAETRENFLKRQARVLGRLHADIDPDRVEDRSTTACLGRTPQRDTVDVWLGLRPGAHDRLAAAAAAAAADDDEPPHWLARRFQLVNVLHSRIRITARDGTAMLADTYRDVFVAWWRGRAEVYERRLRREAALLRLRILELEEVARYVEAPEHSAKMRDFEDAAAASTYLHQNGFRRLRHGFVHEPQYTPVEELEAHLGESLADSAGNHSHLDLRESQKHEAAKRKRAKKLAALRDELKQVEADQATPIVGSRLWLAELTKLREAVAYGRSRSWLGAC